MSSLRKRLNLKPLDVKAAKLVIDRLEDVERPRGGGLIPPPEWVVNQRIDALEARVAELERKLADKARGEQ